MIRCVSAAFTNFAFSPALGTQRSQRALNELLRPSHIVLQYQQVLPNHHTSRSLYLLLSKLPRSSTVVFERNIYKKNHEQTKTKEGGV
jgi:hypothetical protein